MTMLDNALAYLKSGFSVVPGIPLEKRTYIAWEAYQKKLPTEDEIRQWWEKWPKANPIIVTGLISGVAVIDIDSSQGKEEVSELIPDNLMFPIAETPRGGEHWYFRCADPTLQTKAGIEDFTKVDVRANGGIIIAPPSIGVGGKQYKWRFDIAKVDLPMIPPALLAKLPRIEQEKPIVKSEGRRGMFQQGRRDEDLFHVANTLVRARMPYDEIFQTLMRLAASCEPPFPIKEAEQKVLSAIKRAGEQPRDIQKEVAQWCSIQEGAFRAETCLNELFLQTKEHKAEARQAIINLSKRGVIEREKGIGVYRLPNKDIEFISIPDNEEKPLLIGWPFEIEKLVHMYPGNVAVIAGTSNAGKSAFCINFGLLNCMRFKVRYQSSEMDGQELKMRLNGFNADISDMVSKIEWVKRASNWWDLIVPGQGNINIIDFMEVYDNFYQMGDWIKKIFDRLNGAIALIAIQKKDKKSEDGRGGAFTREKARLYLSMDYGRIKIVKGKNWATAENPNGKVLNFELNRGIVLKSLDWWDNA